MHRPRHHEHVEADGGAERRRVAEHHFVGVDRLDRRIDQLAGGRRQRAARQHGAVHVEDGLGLELTAGGKAAAARFLVHVVVAAPVAVDLVTLSRAQLVADADARLYLVAEAELQEGAVVALRLVDRGAATESGGGRAAAAAGELLRERIPGEEHAGVHRHAVRHRHVVLHEERIGVALTDLGRLRREVTRAQGRDTVDAHRRDQSPAVGKAVELLLSELVADAGLEHMAGPRDVEVLTRGRPHLVPEIVLHVGELAAAGDQVGLQGVGVLAHFRGVGRIEWWQIPERRHRDVLVDLARPLVADVERTVRAGEVGPVRRGDAAAAVGRRRGARRVVGREPIVGGVERVIAVAERQLMARGRGGSELAEIFGALAHFVGQRRAGLVDAVPLDVPLVAGGTVEEEQVADHRAAEAGRRFDLAAQQRIPERSWLQSGGGETRRQLVGAHQPLGQPIDAAQTREAVRAAPAHGVGHGPGAASELGGDSRPGQVHLGDVELIDLDRESAECRTGDVGAVEQVGVVLAAAAGGEAHRAAVFGHARRELKQAAVGVLDRHAVELVLGEGQAGVGGTHVHHRRDRAHGDRFADGDAEEDIHLGVAPDGDDGSARDSAGGSASPSGAHRDGVFARRQVVEAVNAVGVGDGVAADR